MKILSNQNVFLTHRTTEPSAINRWVASINNISASRTSSTFLIHFIIFFCFSRHLVDVDTVDTLFDEFFKFISNFLLCLSGKVNDKMDRISTNFCVQDNIVKLLFDTLTQCY